jgi:chromate transporter
MNPKAMNKADTKSSLQVAGSGVSKPEVSLAGVFLEFLKLGATSFGGVVPYLREALVAKRQWLDDKEFVEMLSISQALPGLNATNMAVLVGDKLRGSIGAIAAIIGMCLPGAVFMYIVGVVYRAHGDHAWATAALQGVAAAAVGLVLSTVVQLSKSSLAGNFDFVFMAITVLAVNRLHQSVPRTLIVVGLLSILFHRPTRSIAAEEKERSAA